MELDTQKLRQQLAEATPGEWKTRQSEVWETLEMLEPHDADARLICSMKNSLPALLDEVERLRAFADAFPKARFEHSDHTDRLIAFNNAYDKYVAMPRRLAEHIKKHGV
jgi:hypothetical protein